MEHRRKTWNPIRGTMHLPQDVNLAEIDWEPLPEPQRCAQDRLFASEESPVAA